MTSSGRSGLLLLLVVASPALWSAGGRRRCEAFSFAPPARPSTSLSSSSAAVAPDRPIDRAASSSPLSSSSASAASSAASSRGGAPSRRPLASEGDWSAYLDEETTGLVYYFNVRTGESAWELPTSTFPVPRLSRSQRRISRRRREEYRASAAWEEAKRGGGDPRGRPTGWMSELAAAVADGAAIGAEAAGVGEEMDEKEDGGGGGGGFFGGVFRTVGTATERAAAAAAAAVPRPAPAWTWRGHDVHAEVMPPAAGSGSGPGAPPVAILVHGFGASSAYWRSTASALADAGYEVHALDLLGQGRSAKPVGGGGVEYSVGLWAEMVDDYAREVACGGDRAGIRRERDVCLVGNSLGSLVALAAAAGDHVSDQFGGGGSGGGFLSEPGRVRGLCLFNCGVGMNSRGITDDPRYNFFQRALVKATLAASDALIFNNPAVLRFVLDAAITRDLLRDVLRSLYKHDPSRVDDALVESFYRPAKGGEGSVEAVRQIYTNDPGPTPMDIHVRHAGRLAQIPIHLVWGSEDEVTPLSGSVGRFYAAMARNPQTRVSLDVVRAGHIPFDDNPEESNGSMLRWLEEVRRGKREAGGGGGGWSWWR